MLECAGCGGLVSEYAARCPACGHTTDDARDIPDPPAESTSPLPDLTPADRPPIGQSVEPRTVAWWLRRPTLAAAAVVVAGAVAAGLLLSSGGSPVPAGLKSLGGQVLAVSPAGALVAAHPASGTRKRFPNLNGGPFTPMAVSADGTRLLDAAGIVFNIAGDGITAGSNAVSKVVTNATSPAASMPFADHDEAVLVLTRSTAASPAAAAVVSLVNGHETALGIVDAAGGDTQSMGAFVSVPAQLNQPHIGHPASPDTRVELRVAGRPPATLVTAAQLNEDVGSLPSTPIQLGVYPDPTGDAVAVVLNPLNPADHDVAMVVLTRQGGVLATFASQFGPIYRSQPVWSPGAHQLAYPTYTNTGAALAIANETGTVEDLPAPSPDTAFGPCVWSPTSVDVVCQGRTAAISQWLYATSNASRLITSHSLGVPLAWVAGTPALSSAHLAPARGFSCVNLESAFPPPAGPTGHPDPRRFGTHAHTLKLC